MSLTHVAVIINPIAGQGVRPDGARSRASRARACFEAHGVEADILVTERSGQAADLARLAVAKDRAMLFAWGGDGTVNEVASVLAFSEIPLAVVPTGSGNGLARSLGIASRPEVAIRQALEGSERRIDVGELGGRLFFNVAGVGFDAHVARLFDEKTASRRGFLTYLGIALREHRRYKALEYAITLDGQSLERRADVVVLSNGPEYGNGARIAPRARADDGWLDIVIAEPRSPVANLRRAVRLMTGMFDRASGVTSHTVRRVTIAAQMPLLFHVDGEPVAGAAVLEGRLHAGALRVRVGQGGQGGRVGQGGKGGRQRD